MFVIRGNLQDYAWGIVDGLRPWRAEPGSEVETGRPEAELWFGAHGNGPSPLVARPGVTLADEVDEAAVPILVKILAAAKPLSLQIHPSEALAESILERQVNDPTYPQLLSDRYAKTEMLIALTDFSGLLGLRDPKLAAQLIDGFGIEGATAADQLRAGEVAAAIRTLLAATDATIAQAERELVERMVQAEIDEHAVAAMERVVENYPGDPGILVAALLDHQQLKPGEALYAPAGTVHSYVHGIGVEVMVASDNVFRLGLTPKTVAVDEALAALDVDLDPVILRPEPHYGATDGAGGGSEVGDAEVAAALERTYAAAGSPFVVRGVQQGQAVAASGQFRLVLVTSGSVTVTVAGQEVTAGPGEAVVLLAEEPDAEIVATDLVFIAQSVSV